MSGRGRSAGAAVIAAAALAFAGCGADNAPKAPAGVSQSAFERQLADAQRVSPADFPAAPELHSTNFKDVLGKRPVALLFATPQLCQSRVCGPVVDIELQMNAEYGDRMAFIHQEVYVDNQVDKGLRPALKAFGLQTEPWLFTFDRSGRVAARLEGSFGTRAFEQAVTAALR